jgi:transketolase
MSSRKLTTQEIQELKKLTLRFRKEILEAIFTAQSGHPGSSFSAIDIISTLFLKSMRFEKSSYAQLNQDVFVLSKGHGVPALYSVLHYLGMLPEGVELNSLRRLGSLLQGHPDRVLIPEVVASTGSLGQGLSIAAGIAVAKKIRNDGYQVFCLTGDGELQEGQIWECAMFAAKYKLNNLTVFVDRNRGQIDGFTETVMPLEPLADKFRAFNWFVETVDGHDFDAVYQASLIRKDHQPICIVANTVKGKGVHFMENQIKWHGVAPNKEEFDEAIKKLSSLEMENVL